MSKTTVFSEPSFYFSPLDEVIFFHWLESIPGIDDFYVDGKGVKITVPDSGLSHSDWRDLIGLLSRYEIDMSPLRILVDFDPELKKWMKNERESWYNAIFGLTSE